MAQELDEHRHLIACAFFDAFEVAKTLISSFRPTIGSLKQYGRDGSTVIPIIPRDVLVEKSVDECVPELVAHVVIDYEKTEHLNI